MRLNVTFQAIYSYGTLRLPIALARKFISLYVVPDPFNVSANTNRPLPKTTYVNELGTSVVPTPTRILAPT